MISTNEGENKQIGETQMFTEAMEIPDVTEYIVDDSTPEPLTDVVEEPQYESIELLDFLRDYFADYPFLMSQRIIDFIAEYKNINLSTIVEIPTNKTKPLTIKYKSGLRSKELTFSLEEIKDINQSSLGYKVRISDAKEMWNFDYINSSREIAFNRQALNNENNKKAKKILDIKGIITKDGVNASCTLLELQKDGEYFTRSIEFVKSFSELRNIVLKHEGLLRFNPTRPALVNMNNNLFSDVPAESFETEEFMFSNLVQEVSKPTLREQINKYFSNHPKILVNKVFDYLQSIFNLDLDMECDELKVTALPNNPENDETSYDLSLEIPINKSIISLQWNPLEILEIKKNPASKKKPTIKVVNEKRYTAEFNHNKDTNNVEFIIEPTMIKRNAMVFYYPRFEGSINEQNEMVANGQVISTINAKNLQRINPNLQARIERMQKIESMERLKEEMLDNPPILIAWYDKIITNDTADLSENLVGRKM